MLEGKIRHFTYPIMSHGALKMEENKIRSHRTEKSEILHAES